MMLDIQGLPESAQRALTRFVILLRQGFEGRVEFDCGENGGIRVVHETQHVKPMELDRNGHLPVG